MTYFFFDAKSTEAKDRRSLNIFYSTILRQLLENIVRNFPNFGKGTELKQKCLEIAHQQRMAYQLSAQDVAFRAAIQMILDELPSRTFLVIDALDECTDAMGEDEVTIHKQINECLVYLETLPKLQIFITSRSLHNMEELAKNKNRHPYIHLQLQSIVNLSNNDILLHIQERIANSSMFPSKMSMLEKALLKKSDVCENFLR